MGTVLGLFGTPDDARRALAALQTAGFAPGDISVVAGDRAGAIGRMLGESVGLAARDVPGLGPVLAAGPIAGAMAGGMAAALAPEGLTEEAARDFEAGVARGGILVGARADASREAEARLILGRGEATAQAGPGTQPDPSARYKIRTDEPISDPIDPNVTAAETEGIVGAGGASGAVIGGVIGMVAAGPIGSAIGVAVGALAGGAAGAAYDYGAAEPEFHREWQAGPHRDRVPWDRAGPAYRYGWESFERADHRGRSWDEVRPGLERAWTGAGAWGDAEPMARSGWHRRAGLAELGGPMGGSFPRDGGNA